MIVENAMRSDIIDRVPTHDDEVAGASGGAEAPSRWRCIQLCDTRPGTKEEPKSHRPRLGFQISFQVQWPSSVRTAQSGQELRSGQWLPHSADGARREVESKS